MLGAALRDGVFDLPSCSVSHSTDVQVAKERLIKLWADSDLKLWVDSDLCFSLIMLTCLGPI